VKKLLDPRFKYRIIETQKLNEHYLKVLISDYSKFYDAVFAFFQVKKNLSVKKTAIVTKSFLKSIKFLFMINDLNLDSEKNCILIDLQFLTIFYSKFSSYEFEIVVTGKTDFKADIIYLFDLLANYEQ